MACSSHTRQDRHSLMKTLPSLPSLYVTCGTCGPSYWNELRTYLLLIFNFFNPFFKIHFYIALDLKSTLLQLHLLYGHKLCSWTRTANLGTTRIPYTTATCSLCFDFANGATTAQRALFPGWSQGNGSW